MDKKLKTTEWLSQAVIVSKEGESQHWNPVLASGAGTPDYTSLAGHL